MIALLRASMAQHAIHTVKTNAKRMLGWSRRMHKSCKKQFRSDSARDPCKKMILLCFEGLQVPARSNAERPRNIPGASRRQVGVSWERPGSVRRASVESRRALRSVFARPRGALEPPHGVSDGLRSVPGASVECYGAAQLRLHGLRGCRLR